MPAFSKRYERALIVAAQAHRDQVRKGTDIPYAIHPVHVSVILIRHGFSEDIVIAGLLHDVVEDTDVNLDVIEAEFGPTVAETVGALTEKKREDGHLAKHGEKRPWEIRKREALDLLRECDPGAVAVKAADLLHNARGLVEQLAHEGPEAWNHYARGPELVLWYYRSVAGIVCDRLGAHPLADETEQAVLELGHTIAVTGMA